MFHQGYQNTANNNRHAKAKANTSKTQCFPNTIKYRRVHQSELYISGLGLDF